MFEWDHQKIILDENVQKQFFISSKIDTTADAVVFKLPAGVESDLNWNEILLQAKKICHQKIIWSLDFEIEIHPFSLTDQRIFQSFVCAIHHFKENIYPLFQEQTIGVILYQGTFDFSSHFSLNDTLERNLEEKFHESHETNFHWFTKTFWVQAFVDYFRMLSYHLPNEVSVILCFDYPQNRSYAESLHLFSKEYFEHFLLAIRGGKIPIEALRWEKGESHLGFFDSKPVDRPQTHVGIIFPTICFYEDLQKLNCLIEYLIKEKILFRILEEKFITEKWDEIDWLIHFEDNGFIRRAIQGFEAAGGQTIQLRDTDFTPLDVIVNRGRGIRTPDLLVPNQSR